MNEDLIYDRICEKTIEICEEIVKKKTNTKYQEIFDMIFEYVEDRELYLTNGDRND